MMSQRRRRAALLHAEMVPLGLDRHRFVERARHRLLRDIGPQRRAQIDPLGSA